MIATRRPHRIVGGALSAALFLGAALAGTGAASTPPAGAAEVERAIFTGTFIGTPEVTSEGGQRVRTYRVAVGEVFGPTDLPTERVRVRSAVPLEGCAATGGPQGGQGGAGQDGAGQDGAGQDGAGQDGAGQESAGQEQAEPGQADETPEAPTDTPPPTSTDRQLRLFNTVVQDGVYAVANCGGVAIASETVLTRIEEQFGAGRPPGSPAEPPPDPFDEVGYLCPDTRDAVALDDSSACEALDDGQAFDRMAAPGLALVIVGVLGLLVARRMGRRRL